MTTCKLDSNNLFSTGKCFLSFSRIAKVASGWRGEDTGTSISKYSTGRGRPT